MSAFDLAFDLVGGWTSPNLFLRLLTIVEGPWEPLREGFVHRDTGERARLSMGPPSPELAATFPSGVDPFAPTIDEGLSDEIDAHRAVVTVRSASDPAPALVRALTVVRATNAALNAGAVAVRCRTSGLAHSAEAFQALAAVVEVAGEESRAEALYGLYVLHARSMGCTLGMHALGRPDVALRAAGADLDLDLARLRALGMSIARGDPRGDAAEPDPRPLPAPLKNPFGLVRG